MALIPTRAVGLQASGAWNLVGFTNPAAVLLAAPQVAGLPGTRLYEQPMLLLTGGMGGVEGVELASARNQRPLHSSALAPTLAQILRRLLGLTPPVAAGGSRSDSGDGVCLLSPLILAAPTGEETVQEPVVRVPVASPTLLAWGGLEELRLERNDTLLWRERARSTTALRGPITWPLAPMQAGERLTLRLRPLGAGGADFAVVHLQAAGAAELQRNAARIAALGQDADRWIAAIAAASESDPALAMALASHPSAPAAVHQALAERLSQEAPAGCR
ncbi:MAG: hypothetical protein ACKOXO_13030 [Cyanobium sp.]